MGPAQAGALLPVPNTMHSYRRKNGKVPRTCSILVSMAGRQQHPEVDRFARCRPQTQQAPLLLLRYSAAVSVASFQQTMLLGAVIMMTGTSGLISLTLGSISSPVTPGMLISDNMRIKDFAEVSATRASASGGRASECDLKALGTQIATKLLPKEIFVRRSHIAHPK